MYLTAAKGLRCFISSSEPLFVTLKAIFNHRIELFVKYEKTWRGKICISNSKQVQGKNKLIEKIYLQFVFNLITSVKHISVHKGHCMYGRYPPIAMQMNSVNAYHTLTVQSSAHACRLPSGG